MTTEMTTEEIASQLHHLHRAIIYIGDGIELQAEWFDHDNQLVGVIKTKDGVIPLLTQYILDERHGEIVASQTREQACEAFAQNVKRVISKLKK